MRVELVLLIFVMGCVSVNSYFCQEDECDEVLIQAINEADYEVDCAIYSFTLRPVSEALLSARDRGVRVRLVMESQQANVSSGEYDYLRGEGLSVRLDGNSRLMHHKFCVIDGFRVITGSYNWSEQATERNDENVVRIQSGRIARDFKQEFERVWEDGRV